jgi:hypothetical protein
MRKVLAFVKDESAATASAKPKRISVLQKYLTTILPLLSAAKSAAIINSAADGCSASAICLIGQT